jgi:hypothetical protein
MVKLLRMKNPGLKTVIIAAAVAGLLISANSIVAADTLPI